MRIALIGAPRARKTETAQAIAQRLGDEVDGVAIVDDYVDRLSDYTNNAYGHFAGYLGNLQCAFKRLEDEQAAWQAEEHQAEVVVTCGTVIETLLYSQLHGYVVQSLPRAEDKQAEAVRMNDTTRCLIMLLFDAWPYDYVFYLPLDTEHESFDATSWDAQLDAQIPTALESYFIQHTTLHGTPEENAESIYEYIKHDFAREAAPEQPSEAEAANVV